MRTADPKNTRAVFVNALNDVRTTFTSSEQSNIPDSAKKLVAEYSFLAAAILLEGFLSDLIVAYISSDSERFRSYLQKRMSIQPDDELATQGKVLASISLSHPSIDQIRSILDPRERNITFETVAEMKASTGKWLSTQDKKRFGQLTKTQSAVLIATKRVRNFLAHRNELSKDIMQQALADPDLPTYLKGNVKSATLLLSSKSNRTDKPNLGWDFFSTTSTTSH
jgi:hypothetical protein